jgi:hypothetical protein
MSGISLLVSSLWVASVIGDCDNGDLALGPAVLVSRKGVSVRKVQRIFIFAALTGIAVVIAKKLGFIGNEYESIEYESGFADSSVDSGEDQAAN